MALDVAWDFLKSPILPETAKQAHKIKPWFIRDAPREKTYHEKHVVDFQHPHTKKIYPMTAYTYYDKDKNPGNIQVHLASPEGDEIGISDFSPWWEAEGTEYQPSGRNDWTGGPIIHARQDVADRQDESGNDNVEEPWAMYDDEIPYDEDKMEGWPDFEDVKDMRQRYPTPESAPVGMGTAMYELAATLGKKHGVSIVPSNDRSEQAMNMWAKHEEKGYWPPNEDMLRVLNESEP